MTSDADRVPMTVKQEYPTVAKSNEGAGSPLAPVYDSLFPLPALVQLKHDQIFLAGNVHSDRVMTILFLNVLHAHYPATAKGWRGPFKIKAN